MLKYNLPENSIFGWAPVYYNSLKDILFNGQLCQTGIAVPYSGLNSTTDTRPVGLCINVASVFSDSGNYTNFQTDAPQCFVADRGSHCIYSYYYNSTELSFKLPCECAGDRSIGYCPLPNHLTLSMLSKLDLYVSGNGTNCHTIDRQNIRA